MIIGLDALFKFILLFPIFQTQFMLASKLLNSFSLVIREITVLYCVFPLS